MTIGQFLRQKRLEKQVALDQVSTETNIRINFLEAIESDRLDLIPSVSQARGFIRLYAAFLGLNPATVFEDVERLNRVEAPASAIAETTTEIKTAKPADKPAKGSRSPVASKPTPPESHLASDGSKSRQMFVEIGAQLREQREALGLSVDDVERQLKIRAYYIDALETGEIEHLPSSVQGRGMLNNYAGFLDLNSEALQMRYAEGLQQRRVEKNLLEAALNKDGKPILAKEPLSGWRRFLTPDLLVGGSILILLFTLVVWGAFQVVRTSVPEKPAATLSSISDVLVGTETPLGFELTGTVAGTVLLTTETPQSPVGQAANLEATLNAVEAGRVQLVVVALHHAFVRVIVDGKEEFNGRVVPGNVYAFSGNNKIYIGTGNAAAVQVYYNRVDQGLLGLVGQVFEMEYTSDGLVTPTPRFTATPTVTVPATLTPLPTNTPLPTPTVPTPTITPVIP